MNNGGAAERVETVVIGAGQAGLSAAHHLMRRGASCLVLDANPRIGDTWRRRWDSLRLFTPARFDGLDGLPFPAAAQSFPSKNEMAEYLEQYAAHFRVNVRTGVRVTRLSRDGSRYTMDIGGGRRVEAEHVVVAMSTFQAPRVPSMSRDLDPAIVQLHSSEYRNPAQLRPGAVLMVGAGNSGAEIAIEVARTHKVWMAGRDVGHVPFRVDGQIGRRLLPFIFRVVFHRVLTASTPIGRKIRPHVQHHGGPLIRVKPKDLDVAGVVRVPKVANVRRGLPVLDDGQVLEVANVVWCTGFHPGFSWIDLPVFDRNGSPYHTRGVVDEEPGLYFVGLNFLYAVSSTMIHGVGRDADHVAETVVSRLAARRRRQAATE
jgi:putative flavoprotein involved in K+ transport